MPTLLALDRVLAGHAADTFGRYELLGRLGAGGMAEVFVARCGELAGMQSLLAVKRILPHLAEDEGFVALFRREAQISLRLRHRAIARVLEVGRVDASWFLAMELVAGESLSHLLRAEKEKGHAVDPRLVAWVGAEIALALHHAHALPDGTSVLEVIHRDVSPQNLLLGFDGAVKLIDFGVARCARLSDATRTGTVRGKLAYGSPEQLAARPLDGRSDLFSLAVVLHEWLAGEPLFKRDSDAATIQAVQTAPIPPLRARAASVVGAGTRLGTKPRTPLPQRRSAGRGAVGGGRTPSSLARASGGGSPGGVVPRPQGSLAGDHRGPPDRRGQPDVGEAAGRRHRGRHPAFIVRVAGNFVRDWVGLLRARVVDGGIRGQRLVSLRLTTWHEEPVGTRCRAAARRLGVRGRGCPGELVCRLAAARSQRIVACDEAAFLPDPPHGRGPAGADRHLAGIGGPSGTAGSAAAEGVATTAGGNRGAGARTGATA